jgi:hypothetical protein
LTKLSALTPHLPWCGDHVQSRPRRHCSAIHEKPCEPDASAEREPMQGAG